MGCAVPPTASALPDWLREERTQPEIGTLIWSRDDLGWQPSPAIACLLRPIGVWVAADDPRLTPNGGGTDGE